VQRQPGRSSAAATFFDGVPSIRIANPYECQYLSYGKAIDMTQIEKNAVWQGTLTLMVLRTLLTMGEQHGYGIARRIEQTSQGRLSINYGTLYPALLKLEQEGLIASEWGVSDNNRKAKFYKLTRAGRKQIGRDTRQWEETNAIMTRFLAGNEE
jgi:transcriptional regulator